jgi:hypothetical protein
MTGRLWGKAGGSFLVCAIWAFWALPAFAQQPPAAGGDLQKQVDALHSQVQTMQKDLDEIKALLAPLRRQAPAIPDDLVIDLGNRPVKGSASAKLTFLELTDYQ